MTGTGGNPHQFEAVAFQENLELKAVAGRWPGSRVTPHEVVVPLDIGEAYFYPFGALVLRDVPAASRPDELRRLLRGLPELGEPTVREDFEVHESPGQPTGFADGRLAVESLTPGRAAVVALTVAQSAAMEYYEGEIDGLFRRTGKLVDGLERKGSVPFRTRPLHRFIGEALATRTEVLSILHLLDKPDATWDDPLMDRIYADLRAEFDLVDRYAALESKLRSVQESLELILDVARDRRLVLLELAVVLLIVLEVIVGLRK
jgi:required for meiotic nuclear division protein 1